MPDYPIILYENLNVGQIDGDTVGLKLVSPRDSIYQIGLYRHDRRPSQERLIDSPIQAFNISLRLLLTLDPRPLHLVRNRFYTDNGIYRFSDFIDPIWAEIKEAVHSNIIGLTHNGISISLCVTCNHHFPIVCNNLTDHPICENCDSLIPGTNTNIFTILNREHRLAYELTEEERHLCNSCVQIDDPLTLLNVQACGECGMYGYPETSIHTHITWRGSTDFQVCARCLQDSDECFECNSYWPVSQMSPNNEELCRLCERQVSSINPFIRSWNFRPSLQFHPEVPTDPLRPLYIGMELEMTWPQRNRATHAASWLKRLWEEYEDILYVKSDSSVTEGWEVVTHPMEPHWALDNFPFDFFQEAINNGASENHTSCGTHIHIDKAALTTAQVWKLLQLHLKLKQLCEQVAGRSNSSYASWDDNRLASIKANMLAIAKNKGRAFGRAERYVPVNVLNETTLELRYMRGSIKPQEIRKNIEWVQALYDFTDYISIQDIKEGVLDQPSYMLGWIMDRDYPALQQWLGSRILTPTPMPERSM